VFQLVELHILKNGIVVARNVTPIVIEVAHYWRHRYRKLVKRLPTRAKLDTFYDEWIVSDDCPDSCSQKELLIRFTEAFWRD
jgi:hypothetical protein